MGPVHRLATILLEIHYILNSSTAKSVHANAKIGIGLHIVGVRVISFRKHKSFLVVDAIWFQKLIA